MIIAIDGVSGAGKSTLAKLVAKEINFNYFNTGMLFRALTYDFLTKNISVDDLDKIEQRLKTINCKVVFKKITDCYEQFILVDGKDVTVHLRDVEVSSVVADYSKIVAVREYIKNVQHQTAKTGNYVFEGRDIGTVVFPNAEFKFYIDCDVKIRARRRFEEFKLTKIDLTLSAVEQRMRNRDYLDIHRELSPLRKAKDAHVIDTSDDTIEESVAKILKVIKG